MSTAFRGSVLSMPPNRRQRVGSPGSPSMGNMHPSVMHAIARQNPYAAAAMSRMSREGREAAQQVAQRAAAVARRSVGTWRYRTHENQLVKLMKEAGILLKTRPNLVRRVAERLGWTRQQAVLFMAGDAFTKRVGWRFAASVEYPQSASVFDYVDGPGMPPDTRTFTRTARPDGVTPFEYHGTLSNAWDAVFDHRSGRHRRFQGRALPTPQEYRDLVEPGPARKRPPRR